MAVIEKRETKDGRTQYRVKVRLKGYPPQTSTHARRSDAKKWAQDTESAIREGRYFNKAEARKHTLGELVDRYIREGIPDKKKNGQKQKAQLLWWKEQLGAYLLSDITPALIAEYRDILLQGITYRHTERSPSTVVRYLAVLSHAFSVAYKEWGWIESSPVKKVKKPQEARGRVRFLDENEKERFLQACKESSNPLLYPVVLIAISTGMRYGEIINLTWADVDLQRKRIVLQDTKNGDRRAVPIAGQALEQLITLEQNRRIDMNLIFPKELAASTVDFQKDDVEGAQKVQKSEYQPDDLSKEEIEKVQKVQKPIYLRGAWSKALKKSNIQNFKFHDLRHCAASYFAMSGASLAEIADILGHKSLSMVQRYAHLSDSHKHGVVDRMNKTFIG